MMSVESPPIMAWKFVRDYMIIVAIGNLFLEILQQPLYTFWQTVSAAYLIFAIIHCWIGDLIIALFCLAVGTISSRVLRSKDFFPMGAIISVLTGVVYTVFSEWRNTSIHHFWSYSIYIPRLPFLGTDLSPILQSFFIPIMAIYMARKLSRDMAILA